MPDGSVGEVVSFPDLERGQCRLRLMRQGKVIGEITLDNALGPDGKATFDKVVEAYDYFRANQP